MATTRSSGMVIRHLERLIGRGSVVGLSEGQLVARFVTERDELAFEAIVTRHGPMVLGVCRRLLHDPQDVEDAFQATFLVLVKKAGSLRDRELLAKWLHGVAVRVASRARRDRSRRLKRERSGTFVAAFARPDDGGGEHDALLERLDLEVARLPDRFRAPVVLCYLQGLTHDQAAVRVGCPVGTIRSRLARARELLRARLRRLGMAPAPGFLPALRVLHEISSLPHSLLSRTVAAAAEVAAGRCVSVGIVTAQTSTLTRGVLRAMSLTKTTTAIAVLALCGAIGAGAGIALGQQGREPVIQPVHGVNVW
jgi:RNA polymerase sigma factor (sigma-70 family)